MGLIFYCKIDVPLFGRFEMKHRVLYQRPLAIGLALLAVISAKPTEVLAVREAAVSVVTDEGAGPAARHGARKITEALRSVGATTESVRSLDRARGKTLVVIGQAGGGGGEVAQLPAEVRGKLPTADESLVIRHGKWKGKRILLLCGGDDRGTMYAALDTADRIIWADDAEDPLKEVRDISESPAIKERAISIYTMNRAYWESRFYDEQYWAGYLDMLAKNRINSLVVIFGYENGGFMAPPYPYFFDVEEFGSVRMIDTTPEQQKRNTKALNRLSDMAHARGVDFSVGIWDHIYRGHVQAGGIEWAAMYEGRPMPSTVVGVTGENLMPYTIAALKKFLKVFPDMDGLQFRMHGESGLEKSEMDAFWTDVFTAMQAHDPRMRFDARAKQLPDSVIETGLKMGVPLRICTKYWMEQMGLPFHPTHVNPQNQHSRRHGYADLLRYPQRYQMHWRMWTGGTARVLLWADPEYVRRFCQSTFVYDSPTFEVCEMLCTKMEAQPHDAEPFELLKPEYQYYDYEFERYWHYFQVWGRVAYNPQTPDEVWQREFQRRMGNDVAPYIEAGLHRASGVLPRIVASCYPYRSFPMTVGWAEKQPLGDLPYYSNNQGSDVQPFLNFEDEARLLIEGGETAKMRPGDNSRWFAETAEFILQQAAEVEKRTASGRNLECDATVVDLKILAGLALFHSNRIHAAVHYNLFERSGDLNEFDEALAWERKAIDAWRDIVNVVGDRYADDLKMGALSRGLCGHWRSELAMLEVEFRRFRNVLGVSTNKKVSEETTVAHVPVRRALPGKELTIRTTVSGQQPTRSVRIRYRGKQGIAGEAEMRKAGSKQYRGIIPASAVREGLQYQIVTADADGDVVSVLVSDDRTPPLARFSPITLAEANKPLKITARVADPSGVKWVRLRYRNVTQFDDYETLEMKPAKAGDVYEAVVPAEKLSPEWDFMYFIEVMDSSGNGKMYPDFEKEMPYVIVKLTR